MAGDKIAGRRHENCRCGCQQVAGIVGTVIEVAAGWAIAEFDVPSFTGAESKRLLVAYETP